MRERATVNRLQPRPTPAGIRDTAEQDTAIRQSKLRRYRPWLVAMFAVLAVAFLAIPVLQEWMGTDRSAIRSQLRFSTVSLQTFVRDVSAQGSVVASVSPTLYASNSGIVTVHVNAGDAVTKGDLVAIVDSPELTNEHEREQTTLDSLETNLQRQAIENKKADLRARQIVDLARVDLTAAERELRRADQSWRFKVISKQDLEKAQDDVERSRIALQHAEQDADLNLESLRFDLKTLRLQRDRQRLAVRNLKRRVSELELLAPVSGIVGNLAVDRRAAVAANAEIATIVDLSALEIELSVSASYADDLAIGATVSVKFAGQEYPAVLVSVSPQVVSGTVSGRVRFVGDQPAGLRQNQRVSARIILESKKNALLVDRGPFYDSGGGRLIYRVVGDIAERVEITVGSSSISQLEILSGLSDGDVVIVSEIDRFKGAERVLLQD
jgi:HlyD family secretion protein